jgi:hypothetical protein
MSLTSRQVEPIERLTELGIKVVLFLFILLGTATLTGFYIYCTVNDKGGQAKALAGFGDAVFFAAFARLVWYYFVSDKRTASVGSVTTITANESKPKE